MAYLGCPMKKRVGSRGNGRPGGLEKFNPDQSLKLATPENTGIENIGKNEGLANLKSHVALTLADIQCRLELAEALADAIGQAHPDDAVQLMAAALADLTPAGSRPNFFLEAEADAAWWASLETPEVLVTVLRVALENLGDRAMHRETRKRLFMTLWRGFTPAEQDRFLAVAKGDA
ncbi:MAG: hypothetical protein IOC98_09090 [Rhodobacter sp.]|nr:hypothetical protein [Rhodobacter sp.]MCA3493670.1 hypothetical protein [Rhodobacter sp.]MCA3500173.1 hypothetical protein [Rhodobacter sp.]